jgi:nucleoside-diphosphate-sugar epimerase
MRILVTGCAGFIGSSITDALLARGDEVVGVDCFTDYYERWRKEQNLESARTHERFELHELDLATADLTPLVEGVDAVIHQAAQAGVRASWGAEFATYTTCNVLATQRLLEAVHLRSGGPVPVVYASSSSVYGNAEARPTMESMLPAPISPYGVTKLAAEHLCDTYRAEFGVPSVSLRYFTVYGPRQRPDMAFHKFVRRAVLGERIEIYGDGHQSRDFTFVADAVAANLAAVEHLAAGGAGGTFNVGGGSTVTVREVLDLLATLVDEPLNVHYGDVQAGDVRHTSASTAAIHAALGWSPTVQLAQGLEREVAWLREQLAVGQAR